MVEGGFPSKHRFRMVRQLGAGAMGVVFEAEDVATGTRVALKTLRLMTADNLARFKREFRALQAVHHPNVVTLHEMVEEDGAWYFTMELIDGVSLLDYVRGEPRRGAIGSAATDPGMPGGADEIRVRSAFHLLAQGLHAFHATGMAHRDLKPSNVLVDRGGRVVIVDFGLVGDGDSIHDSTSGSTVGTVAYMAPEQAAGTAATSASDWYAVGAMLYEALTTQLPFDGHVLEVLLRKQAGPPPWPATGPDDLRALCMELLTVAAEQRPVGKSVVGRLAPGAATPNVFTSAHARVKLVGRGRELAALERALDSSQHMATVVCIHGESGIGKTSIVQDFVGRAAERGAVILEGRCYEHETVPYKAFDGVIDALARRLRLLPSVATAALIPRHVELLLRVFPVLGRIENFADAPRSRLPLLDPVDLRSRALTALRELFGRFATRTPTIVVVDDAQWADADSRTLVNVLLEEPESPPLLLLVTSRVPRPEFLTDVRGVIDLPVPALRPESSVELATTLLRQRAVALSDSAKAIADESEGHPLFVDALVMHLAQGGAVGAVSLERALQARAAAVEVPAQQLLGLVCVAGGAVDLALLAAASQGSAERVSRDLRALNAAKLVRAVRLPSGRHGIEPAHDKVRAAIIAELAPDALARAHRALAQAIEATASSDPEQLALHWLGAGEPARAARHALAAAERAMATTAFDRAARFFLQALPFISHGQHQAAHTRLGDALVAAGRSSEGARHYLEAAGRDDTAQAVDLRRRAADQLLLSGHIDEGLALMRTMTEAIGFRFPETPRRAIISLVVARARLILRGLNFRERPASAISAVDLARVDTCYAAAMGLGMADNIRGADFQARGLLMALKVGEPGRVARALAAEAGFAAISMRPDHPYAREALRRSLTYGRRAGDPTVVALACGAAALAAYQGARYAKGLALADRSAAIFRERCTNTWNEMSTARLFALWCLVHLGALVDVRARWPALLREARERGDRLFVTNLVTGKNVIVRLALDEVAEARQDVDIALREWSHDGCHLQHYWAMLARCEADLYESDPARAHSRLGELWPRLARSKLLRIFAVRIEAWDLRARVSLALAQVQPMAAARLLRRASADATELDKVRANNAAPLALLLRAQLAAVAGNPAKAIDLLAAAHAGFHAASMRLHAAVCARQLAIVGGHAAYGIEANAYFMTQNVVRPASIARVIGPALDVIAPFTSTTSSR